jgi:hypothetical protein
MALVNTTVGTTPVIQEDTTLEFQIDYYSLLSSISTTLTNVNTSLGTINTTLGTINTSLGTSNTTLGTINTSLGTINTSIGTGNTDVTAELSTISEYISTISENSTPIDLTLLTDAISTISENLNTIALSFDNSAELQGATIQGNVLTVESIAQGTITKGMRLVGEGVLEETYIVDGQGTEWTVNKEQNVGPVDMVATNDKLVTSLHNLESHQKVMKELATTTGIRVATPYEWVTLVSIYKLLIEEDRLLDGFRELSEADKIQAQERIADYLEKVKEFFPPSY